MSQYDPKLVGDILFLGRILLASTSRWPKTSYLLWNFNTLENILMILGRNVEQDKMTCRVQE